MYDLINEPDNKKIFWNKEMAVSKTCLTLFMRTIFVGTAGQLSVASVDHLL